MYLGVLRKTFRTVRVNKFNRTIRGEASSFRGSSVFIFSFHAYKAAHGVAVHERELNVCVRDVAAAAAAATEYICTFVTAVCLQLKIRKKLTT